MRVSLNWLKELVDIDIAVEELGQILTIAGFEVEDIEDLRSFADGVVVGKVIKRDRHPDADKLSVCQVDVGQETALNIVCGASNVKADIFVPVATVGTYLPAVDLKLKPTKLRGVPSEGMICSLSELGLEKDSEGIHIFSGDIQPGDDVRPLLGLDDVILDLATTANRADALSMVGIAREVAALTGVEVKLPEVPTIELNSSDFLQVKVTATQACPAYIGTAIEGVKVAPSPQWLQQRLQAGGVRPINNVVDITNYVLLEWGQPLHAFDREKLQQVAGSSSITLGVSFAKAETQLTTLDEQERQLESENLLITAGDNPVALAGVMGGANTEVDENTTNVVLESALFDPVAVRRSSRVFGLRSESSTRYERGVNQVELDRACDRAVALLQEIAGGKAITRSMVDNRPDWNQMPAIELRLARIHQLLGEVKLAEGTGYITREDVEQILTALGCTLTPSSQADTWLVKIPPYRYRDLEREIDLIEEVARLYGYDRFCDTLPDKTEPGYLSPEYQAKNKLRAALRGVGLTELVHYSLVKPTAETVTLANPLLAEYSALRTNLIDGLIEAFAYNQSQGNGGLNGFEVGRVFWKTEAGGIGEGDKVAGIMGGSFYPEGSWTSGGKPSVMTWYEAKGTLESVFNLLGLGITYRTDSSDTRLHPGRTASLWLEGKQIGLFGQLHPELTAQKDLGDEVYVFELAFTNLATALNRDKLLTPKFKPYSAFPGSQRDLAFFAPLDLTVTEIEKIMTKAGGKLLDKVELFDEYKGKGVPEGQRSLAFNLVYRSSDRTLKDKDVDPVHQKVRDTLVKKFSVTLRS